MGSYTNDEVDYAPYQVLFKGKRRSTQTIGSPANKAGCLQNHEKSISVEGKSNKERDVITFFVFLGWSVCPTQVMLIFWNF